MSDSLFISILTCNRWEITEKCLKALYKYTSVPFYLFLVDNGSKDGTPDKIRGLLRSYDNFDIAENAQNKGVIGGRNQSLVHFLESGYDSLLFLDNDQIITKDGWMDGYLSLVNKGYDIIGIDAWRLSRNFFPSNHILVPEGEISYVGCGGMWIKREVPQKIGCLDEAFNPCFFEDPDFCFRAHNAGFKIVWHYLAPILHLGHQTIGKMSSVERTKQFSNSYNIFREKWKNQEPLKIDSKLAKEVYESTNLL
jgi:hypothetical protein